MLVSWKDYSILDRVDLVRSDANWRLNDLRRAESGQHFTPAPVARFMAAMFLEGRSSIRLLDPGAGIGTLSAAFVEAVTHWEKRPDSLSIVAYEIDPLLVQYLEATLDKCSVACKNAGVRFTRDIRREDFIRAGVSILHPGLSTEHRFETFDCAILNPPYHKIQSKSEERRLLSTVGIETSNVYAGFVAIAVQLLGRGGELVAITPRSFCNGPYFKPFRKFLLDTLVFRRIHVFEKRDQAFREDNVLQENIVFHAIRSGAKESKVLVSSNESPDDEHTSVWEVKQDELVQPEDTNFFIRLMVDGVDQQTVRQMAQFKGKLWELGASVSTGRVVDFRAKDFLRKSPEPGTAPLVRPEHLRNGNVIWPNSTSKKPDAILVTPRTEDLLTPAGVYVLVKRFTAKEEPKRVVAAVYNSSRVAPGSVGIENHVNYFHMDGAGLPLNLATGLCAFLNSTLVDEFFRQFNGHTQVNAADLRSLKYPSCEALEQLGEEIGDSHPVQSDLDQLIKQRLLSMSADNESLDPVQTRAKIEQALQILRGLGLPRQQINERSALTLLALLDLKPDTPWSAASAPLLGITQMMDYFAEHFGKTYAPNTRETVRRQTVHQFVQAGICVINPDDPLRPTNSPNTVYQVEPNILVLMRSYGASEWLDNLKAHLTSVETLRKQYERARNLRRVPIKINEGATIALSPGGQNILVKKILEDFCPAFTPGGRVVYVGDTDNKWAYFDLNLLADLGVFIEEHGKIPDVAVYLEDRGWLVLIEAVTSHGPVNPKRHRELRELFGAARVGLVFVTAFLDRRSMVRFLSDIAWETEVWVADAPEHLIHFNGERFLGPHES